MTDASHSPIYLDHNATTPVAAEVLEAMEPFLRREFGNPSSSHAYGRRARRAVDRARRSVASMIGASPGEIVFTSGGTESNNLAICGAVGARSHRSKLVTSVIEHPSVAHPCRHLEQCHCEVEQVGVDSAGRIDAERLVDAIDERTALVTVMHANNVTGAVQPLADIAAEAKKRGALVHTDAAQSAGKCTIDVEDLGVDLLTIAGHKMYAPKGIGVLYIREGVELQPLLRGAGHERGRRPGTENVPYIAGLGRACEVAEQRGERERKRAAKLGALLWQKLDGEIPELALNGPEKPEFRLPNTLNVRFPGVDAKDLLARTPEIAASTGSACKEGGRSPSPVLKAMGLSDREAFGSMRLSLGCGNTEEEIRRAADLLIDAWQKASDG